MSDSKSAKKTPKPAEPVASPFPSTLSADHLKTVVAGQQIPTRQVPGESSK